jgi:hypothetical protein
MKAQVWISFWERTWRAWEPAGKFLAVAGMEPLEWVEGWKKTQRLVYEGPQNRERWQKSVLEKDYEMNEQDREISNISPQTRRECPPWALEKIEQLRQVEIYLGNIPAVLAWKSSHLEDLASKAWAPRQQVLSDEVSELLFAQVVNGLRQEGYELGSILSFLNERIGYEGGPPYCDLGDVEAVANK